jgi:hypothetical protein
MSLSRACQAWSFSGFIIVLFSHSIFGPALWASADVGGVWSAQLSMNEQHPREGAPFDLF